MNTPQERSSSGASVTARHEGNCPAWGRLPDTENSPSARPHGAQTLFGPGAIGRGTRTRDKVLRPSLQPWLNRQDYRNPPAPENHAVPHPCDSD